MRRCVVCLFGLIITVFLVHHWWWVVKGSSILVHSERLSRLGRMRPCKTSSPKKHANMQNWQPTNPSPSRAQFFEVAAGPLCLSLDSGSPDPSLHVTSCDPHDLRQTWKLDHGLLFHALSGKCVSSELRTEDCWTVSANLTWSVQPAAAELGMVLSISERKLCLGWQAGNSRRRVRLIPCRESDVVVWSPRFRAPHLSVIGATWNSSEKRSLTASGECPALTQQSIRRSRPLQIAFFIRASRNAAQLRRLLDLIYRDEHVYLLHIDAKAGAAEVDAARQIASRFGANVLFMDPPSSIHYMGYDLMFLDVKAIRLLLDAGHQWDYWINLSSQELPVISMEAISSLLKEAFGYNFVDVWCTYRDAPKYKKNRLDLQWDAGRRVGQGTSSLVKPQAAHFVFGSFYVALTRSFCESLFTEVTSLEILVYLRNARVPDELFFGSALLSSPQFRCTHFNSNFRFVDWGRSSGGDTLHCSMKEAIDRVKGPAYLSGGSHPCILGSPDLLRLQSSHKNLYWFANKFDDAVDPNAYTLAKKYTSPRPLSSTVSQIPRLWNAERLAPHRLHCPDYQGAGV